MCEQVCARCEDCDRYQNGCRGITGTFMPEMCELEDDYYAHGRYE